MDDWGRVFPVTVGDSMLEFVSDSDSQLTLRLVTREDGQVTGIHEQPVDVGSFEREHPLEFRARIARNVELFEERRKTGEQDLWPPTPQMLVADPIDFVPLSSRGTVDELVQHLRDLAESGSSAPQYAVIHWPSAAKHLYWLSVWLEYAGDLRHQGNANLDALEDIHEALDAAGCTGAREASRSAQSAYLSASPAESTVEVDGAKWADSEVRPAMERLVDTHVDVFYE